MQSERATRYQSLSPEEDTVRIKLHTRFDPESIRIGAGSAVNLEILKLIWTPNEMASISILRNPNSASCVDVESVCSLS